MSQRRASKKSINNILYTFLDAYEKELRSQTSNKMKNIEKEIGGILQHKTNLMVKSIIGFDLTWSHSIGHEEEKKYHEQFKPIRDKFFADTFDFVMKTDLKSLYTAKELTVLRGVYKRILTEKIKEKFQEVAINKAAAFIDDLIKDPDELLKKK